MNIRFSPGAVRCRVTHDELDSLLVGRAVALEVALPRHHTFRLNVRPAAVGGWQLDSDPTGMWIAIPRGALESLSQSLPSKEGIEQSFEVDGGSKVLISFEVDLRRGIE